MLLSQFVLPSPSPTVSFLSLTMKLVYGII